VTCPTGCCVGDICAFGDRANACGTGGAQCQNCANQTPARVCDNGKCQLPTCSPANCKNGCCSNNVCVTGTTDNACGQIGGGQCADCTDTNQQCVNRQCVGRRCNASTCPDGCCRGNSCESGFASNACGEGGAACANCTASSSYCNGLVSPRRCNNQQNECPADYGACNAGPIPAPQLRQNLCRPRDLSALLNACINGPEDAACIKMMSSLPGECQKCLSPFNRPFNENAGLYACAAASVGAPCRQAMGCAVDCADTSCAKCSASSEDTCYLLSNGLNGQCRTYYAGATLCTNDALAPGRPCSQFTYAHFGEWISTVGDRFCGNGP
jgi:hypothetical protein